jgi:uncharacterized C2H2 Zn-finger protein
MSNKTCPTCKKTFNNTSNYNYHVNRKKPCVSPESENENAPVKKYKCNRCEATFQTNQNLTTHLNRKFPCKIKNPTPEEIELRLLFEQLKEEHLRQQEENENLKMKIDRLENQPGNNTTNNIQNNNNNIQNNTTNNITINVYGNEDTSHINDAMLTSCFNDFDKSVEKYFGMKHFSKRMKCNHNIYISNMRDGYMMIYNSKEWNIANRAVAMKKMYYEIKESLSEAWDMMCNKNAVPQHIKSIYPRFIEYEIDDEREERFQTASCDKMACMAYNNRKFPMKIKKQMEKNG